MIDAPVRKIILGNFFSPKSDKKFDWFEEGAMVLKRSAKNNIYQIENIIPKADLSIVAKYWRSYEVIDYSNKLIIPPFCDLHFHWVQDDVRKMPKDSLLTWLKDYTWPMEKKFSSKLYTKNKAKKFNRDLIDVGTLSGACFGSIHEHSVIEARNYFPEDIILGNVLMTMHSPDYLIQSPQEAVSLVKNLSRRYKQNYAVTPRFAITAQPDVMARVADIGRKNNSFIQSHLCETKEEIEFVLDIFSKFPGFNKVKTYTEVYKKSGILGAKTIMGHGIHLNNDELKMLSKTKTAIAHCPSSNAPVKQLGLGSGLFNFKKVEKAKIRWAFGSDIGAGPYLSMIDVINSFIRQNKNNSSANYVKAIYRSTLAGAEILEKSHKFGSFEEGKDGSFLTLPLPRLPRSSTVESLLKKALYCPLASREDSLSFIESVYKSGHKIK